MPDMPDFTIEELTIPPSLAEDRDGDFAAQIDIRNAIEVTAYRTPEVALSAADLHPLYLDPHEPKRVFLARIAGRVVGRGLHLRDADDTDVVRLKVEVLPAFEGRGVGTALADTLESLSREAGAVRAIVNAVSRDADGPRRQPPTGFGSVPAGNREVRFLLARGWSLEQVERVSRFPLPPDADELRRLRAEAESHAVGYRVVTWAGATSADRADDIAVLLGRMSMDEPTAGLDVPPEVWTAERVLRREQLIGSSRLLFTAAILHEASGHLVGYTRLVVRDDPASPFEQWDTIVLGEHRGHRLGMLLKIANLQFVQETAPGHPSVITSNAEENRHMLSTNEAVGFVPIGYEGAWQLRL